MKYKTGRYLLMFLKGQFFLIVLLVMVACTINTVFAQVSAVAIVNSLPEKLSGLYDSKQLNAKTFDVSNLYTKQDSDFLKQYPNYKELVYKRTFFSRTFSDGIGGVIINYSSNPLHYRNKLTNFEAIDARLYLQNNNDGIAWCAYKQQNPTWLFTDGSTAIESEYGDQIIFNKKCTVNGVTISMNHYTVGVDGMYAKNIVADIDKKIVFATNRIKTDYILNTLPALNNNDLVISEEMVLPKGYYILPDSILFETLDGLQHKKMYVVYSADGKEQLRFNAPLFYDANKSPLLGQYKLVEQNGVYVLQIVVPYQWLAASSRLFPVIIDPLVTGPTSNYPSVFMSSCVLPVYQQDSMPITIPAGITITGFIVEDSYFADALSSPAALMKHGKMKLATACGAVTFTCQGTTSDSSGTCYLVPNTDLKDNLACCFTPSCTDQTFYLTHGLGRDNYGPGCNQTYIYYSPFSNWPFSAYIVGKTVETTQAQWSVFPTTVCSDSCIIYIKATTRHGVPPYTISHPWAQTSSTYGVATDGCTVEGQDTIAIAIPGCPSTCGTNLTLDIPPPVIVDACNAAVTGLTSKSISIKPVPVATLVASDVCSGELFTASPTSCVTGSTFQWQGSSGGSGTGDVSEVLENLGSTVYIETYTVTPTANGCQGDEVIVAINVNPLPEVVLGNLADTTDAGVAVQLSASGASTYVWSPAVGLLCSDCDSTLASPTITTAYYVTGYNQFGCSDTDTVEIVVNQGTESLYIPNSFSPNSNELNDFFMVKGSAIKNIDIKIFNRWGELVYETKDLSQGWDGKYKGVELPKGVYSYSITCEWLSGDQTRRLGKLTLIR
ncbi:MAG: gliding motility-associated C-terminal domain-containing protein [Bacteroidia bacterium]